jgi:hypothetical protein
MRDRQAHEHPVVVAAFLHEVGHRHRICPVRVERLPVDLHVAHAIARRSARIDAQRQSRDLRELSGRRGQLRHSAVERLQQHTARHGDFADDVAERMDLDQRAAGDRTGRIDAIAADTVRIHDRHVGVAAARTASATGVME